MIPALNKESLAIALKDPSPLVIQFWANWCGPCKAIKPYVEALAVELDGKVRFARVNVDDEAEITRTHDVRAIPTLLVFVNGQVKDSMIGLMDAAKLKAKTLEIVGLPPAVVPVVPPAPKRVGPKYTTLTELSAAFKSGELDDSYSLFMDKGGCELYLRQSGPEEGENARYEHCKSIFKWEYNSPLEELMKLAGIPAEHC